MNYKKYIILLLIVITGNWPASADTDEGIVFGPVTYERTADSPDIFESEFSNPYSEGNFTLYLQNGRDGNHKISSATIILNGETIVRQNEFNQAVNYINRSIKLKPSNNLKVRLNSKPGGVITLYVKKEHVAPVVEINFPIANAYHPVKVPLDGTPVVLETVVIGTVKGNVTNVTIEVNNDIFEATIVNNTFYQNVMLIEGANQIRVSAVDSAGYTGSTNIVAYVENTNAELKIPIPPPSPFENEKLSLGLNYTAYLYETQGIDAAVEYLKINPNLIVENGSFRVRIPIPVENEIYVDTLKSIGINVLYITNSTDVGGEIEVHAFLPISKIRALGELVFLKAVYVENKPSLESITEGDAIIGSDKVRTLGFTGLKPDGSSVRVAVIDTAGSKHEAQVIDVVRAIAPGAQVTNYSGDWNQGISNATKDGVDIITVSQSAPWLDLDGTDHLSDQIKNASRDNVLYINAAGNYANLHYKGKYQDNNNNGWHEFAGYILGYDETLNVNLSFLLDESVTAYLHINPADLDKLDIKVGLNNTESLPNERLVVRESKGVRSITISPSNYSDVRFFVTNSSKYKSSEVVGTPFHIFVLPYTKMLDKQLQWIDNSVKESSIPAPATSRYSFTVGATYSDLIESYSDKVAYLAAVNRIRTGNVPAAIFVILSSIAVKQTFPQDGLPYFSGQGPVYDASGSTIIKPDIVAPTVVSTDHGVFGGTSASAPHVAGAAALLLSANPALTADQLQQVLEESAVDLGDPGKDNKYGAGRIDIYEAVKKVTPDLQPSNIQLIQNTATEGLNVTIIADVSNTGYWDAQNVEVQFLENNTVINTSIIPLLKAGNTATIETKWLAGNYGSYNISVSIDPANRIPEFNESNNHASRVVDLMWLEGWGYRKKLTIKGSTAGAQTNYQMKLNVHAGNGIDTADTVYLNNNIAGNDFRDLRFTKSDGVTLLDYWIESYVSGYNARVWAEVDNIPASPDTVDVYVYYGNGSASVYSNGEATFLFFDDFSGNLSKWAQIGGGSWTVENGYAKSVISNDRHLLVGNINVSDCVVNARINLDPAMIGNLQAAIGARKPDLLSDQGGYDYIFHHHPSWPNQDRGLQKIYINWLTINSIDWSPAVWYDFELRLFGSSIYGQTDDGISSTTADTSYTAGLAPVLVSSWTGVRGNFFDDVRVRKYVNPEPTWEIH